MNHKKRKLAIISPLKPTYSETFIRAHIDLLPCDTYLFYSLKKRGYHPIFNNEDEALFSSSILIHYLETAIERISNPAMGYYFRKKALRKYLNDHGIDAVMAEYGPSGTMIMEDCRELEIPLIVHFHGRDAYHYETIKKYGKRYLKMFEIASEIIVVSSEMKEELIGLGCAENKISITPCGPNSDFNLDIDVSSNDFQFVTTGRFVDKKAPQLAIRAFHKAQNVFEESKLVMLADGPLWEECKALVKELKLEDKVYFLGPQSKDFIIDLFKKSFAFVQHSVRAADGDSEGTPVSILEAMLAGLPVLSTRHAGIKDVVVEKESGLLVDEGDWESMGDNMIALMEDRKIAQIMGTSGKKRVEENFTLNHHLETVWSVVYRNIK